MYNSSNSTTTRQVADFIHHWKDCHLFGENFILPVAGLEKQTKRGHSKSTTINPSNTAEVTFKMIL